jgi:hypothetical protein
MMHFAVKEKHMQKDIFFASNSNQYGRGSESETNWGVLLLFGSDADVDVPFPIGTGPIGKRTIQGKGVKMKTPKFANPQNITPKWPLTGKGQKGE